MLLSEIFVNFIALQELNLDNKSIIDYCYDLKEKDKGRVISNIHGWQSNGIDWDKESPLNELFSESEKIFNNVHKHYKFKNTFKQEIINGWININQKDNYNVLHSHPRSFFSGVYYPKAPTNSGNIVFKSPIVAHEWAIDDSLVESYNGYNSFNYRIEPRDNIFIVFPAWLEHHVLPNESDEDRISIAINSKVVSI